ncbi:MAG: Sortase domain, partial [Actinomycetota bacterium]
VFAHRTDAGGPFRYIDQMAPGDSFSLIGADGRSYNYVVMSENVTVPSYWNIYGLATLYPPITAQLIACSKADGSPTSLSYRLVITGRLVSIT